MQGTSTRAAYYTRTVVGTFWIRPDNVHGWSLFIDDDRNVELLGSYSSPEAAADDVYTQHTGALGTGLSGASTPLSDCGLAFLKVLPRIS